MSISITKEKNDIISCECCDKTNFDSPFAQKTDKPFYCLRIGYTKHRLCEDCLNVLLKTIDERDC